MMSWRSLTIQLASTKASRHPSFGRLEILQKGVPGHPSVGCLEIPWIVANAALGGVAGVGGANGEGIGGGLYIDTGALVTLTKSSKVILNFASTSADDIFGIYTTT